MRTTRTIRAEIPADVWDRLAAEAEQSGIAIGTHLRRLIVARDTRRQSKNSPAGASPSTSNEGES